jgi:hypothetical protein
MSQNLTVNTAGTANPIVDDESVSSSCLPGGKNSKHEGSKGHVHGAGCKHDHAPDSAQSPDTSHFLDEESGHSHKHKHGHKKGDSKSHNRNKMFQEHSWQIRVFTLGMPFQALIITMTVLNNAYVDYPFDYWFGAIFMPVIIAGCSVAYYKATFSVPFAPARTAPVWIDPKQSVICKNCSFWKPERAHHCSTCGKCVLRMDHHCPWIVNCVGFKNHRAFLLFSIYMCMGAIFFVWRSVYYLIWATNNDVIWEHSYFFLIWWAIVIMIIAPTGVMLGGLAIFHSMIAVNNTTTLESMGGNNIRVPCLSDSRYLKSDRYYPNLYDKGAFANICEFFDYNSLTWWWPSLKDVVDEGIAYSRNPPINSIELAIRLEKKGGVNAEPNPIIAKKPASLADFDYEDVLKKSEESVFKKNLQFDSEIFEYGKREDNSRHQIES